MQTCVFDIETNAIDNFQTLDGLEKLHCMTVICNGKSHVFSTLRDNIDEGLKMLELADVIVGHNVINFDIPAIKKLYPNWKPQGLVRDTLVMCRVVWPDIRNNDKLNTGITPKLCSSHSLKAWGERLDFAKGSYGEAEDAWDVCTEDMEAYCVQDTELTLKLYEFINSSTSRNDWTECFELEHSFAEAIQSMQAHGFAFDEPLAKNLYSRLRASLLKIEEEMQEVFPAKQELMKTPQYWIAEDNSTFKTKKAAVEAGHKGILLKPGPLKVKTTPFNPASRVMIADAFKEKYNWKPTDFTQDGRAKVDETVLNSLSFPEAKLLSKYLMLTKRIGQLGDGKESWLKLCKDGMLHGQVNPNGAVTGRCTHSKPNCAQVPSVTAPYGLECRGLFTVKDPVRHRLVGADASGLELRMLAHYMARYDNGAYVSELLTGDIHSANMRAAGLTDRNTAKSFIYAYLYGAGDAKIGDVVGCSAPQARKLKKKFLDQTPALKKLKAALDAAYVQRGSIFGLDGRRVPIRSRHSILNTLLQCAGAVVMKKATTLMVQEFRKINVADTHIVAHIHDEVQIQALTVDAQLVGHAAVQSIQDAGKHFNLRCPLDGEFKIGRTWADTH